MAINIPPYGNIYIYASMMYIPTLDIIILALIRGCLKKSYSENLYIEVT
jgi:hypothetical protein